MKTYGSYKPPPAPSPLHIDLPTSLQNIVVFKEAVNKFASKRLIRVNFSEYIPHQSHKVVFSQLISKQLFILLVILPGSKLAQGL